MMAYRTKVTVMMNGKEYRPGDVLPDGIPPSDFDFLKSKRFIEVVDIPAGSNEDSEEDFEGFNGDFSLKSVEEIRRIRSKKDADSYAASIGFDLGDYEKKSLKELQEEIINYQEEQEDDGDDEESNDDGDAQKDQESDDDGDD